MHLVLGIVLVSLVASTCYAAIDDILRDATPDKSAFGINADGSVRVEYDILLTKKQWEERQALKDADPETRAKRKAERRSEYRWTNNEIPYEMASGEFTADVEQMILESMKMWEKYVCIQFRPRQSSDNNYVHITINGPCSSYVGMQGYGRQYLTLGPSCHIPSIIMHELGHAIGFEHEQCRGDRDDYVTLVLDNVYPNRRYNFDLIDTDNQGVEYDYKSIMHYSEYAFSSNGKRTIITTDADWQHKIGYSYMLSFRDVKLANAIYSCGDQCPSCTHWEEEAYADENCQCQCPGTPAKVCGTTGGDDGLEGCVDNDDGCEETAALGYCDLSPDYAKVVCPKSCGCGDPSRAVCKDIYDACPSYKQTQDCGTSDFMQQSCRKTCGICGGDGVDDACVDQDENCGSWADYGECDRNPGYMHENCARSCGTC